jgi:hypothetical protein
MNNSIQKHGIAIIALIFTTILLYYASNDPTALISRTYLYIFTIIIPICFALLYLNSKDTLSNVLDKSNNIYVLFAGVSVVFIICLFFFMYTYLNATTLLLSTYLLNILLFCIFLIILTIIYNIIGTFLNRQTGVFGFFIQLLFYLPCLFNDFIIFLKNELKLTPNIVYILFIAEVVVILLFIYIPPLIKLQILPLSGKKILNTYVYLGNQIEIANNDMFIRPLKNVINEQMTTIKNNTAIIDGISQPIQYIQNYGLSMWVNLNQQEKSTKEMFIFKYGTIRDGINTEFKPALSTISLNEKKTETNLYNLYLSDSMLGSPDTTIEIPSQSWNHIVFIYKNNAVSVFINGKLVKSIIVHPTYSINDTMTIGDKGLVGAIKNVTYYTENIPSDIQILQLYNSE